MKRSQAAAWGRPVRLFEERGALDGKRENEGEGGGCRSVGDARLAEDRAADKNLHRPEDADAERGAKGREGKVPEPLGELGRWGHLGDEHK